MPSPLPGVPILGLTSSPSQIPISQKGSTIINAGTVNVTLSTDAIPTSANSYVLKPNASIPIMNGPLWGSCVGSGQVLVVPQSTNYYDPNTEVLAAALKGLQVEPVGGLLTVGATSILNGQTVQILGAPTSPTNSIRLHSISCRLIGTDTGEVLFGPYSSGSIGPPDFAVIDANTPKTLMLNGIKTRSAVGVWNNLNVNSIYFTLMYDVVPT